MGHTTSNNSTSTPEAVGNYRSAYDICEEITVAAEFMDMANKLGEIAQRKASNVVMKTTLGNLPFIFNIEIPKGVEAYITHDDKVVEPDLQLLKLPKFAP